MGAVVLRILGIVQCHEKHSAARGADAARQRLGIVRAAVSLAAEQVQMVLAALQLVVVLLLIFIVVDGVEVVAAAALQLGQIVVDAADVFVQVVLLVFEALFCALAEA